MMKTFLLVISALLLNSVASFAQWNATLNIVPYPSPYVSDWQNNTSQVGQLMIFNNSNSPAQVKILSIARLQGVGKVFEGTSDEITVQPGIPTTIDVTRLIKFGEATFPERHLKNQSIETGRLPEGQYELSVTVLNPSNPQTPLVSNVDADFTIIYPDPPSLIFPDQQDQITSEYPTFQWTPVTVPPDYTIYYSLKIVQVLDGQTPQRALEANIPQFEKDHLTTTTFTYPIDALPLDTNKTYAWRVTALDQNNFPPTHNNGKSQIYTFTYKGQSSGMIHVLGPGNPDTTGHTHSATEALTMAGSGCPGGTPGGISHTDIDTSSVSQIRQLHIGGFLIHPDQIQLQNASGHTYRGTGYITWNPFGNPSPIKLAVSFNDIKINTDREVYQGTVTTTITDNSEVSAWTSLASASSPGAINDGSKTSSQYASFDAYLSAPDHSIRSLSGNAPVDFPLALRNQSLSSTSPLALMGITFTPGGASMNVLYNLNLPNAGKWISFFNTCLPVTPDGIGISSGHSAVLYLPNAVSMTLSDGTFQFKNSSPADTAGGTYVKWNSNGLQTIVATAERSFSQSYIVPVDGHGAAMSQPETMQLKFTFTDWNDWIARATPDHDFEIARLPGFSISASGSGYYDHSANRNPGGLNSSNFPQNYRGNKLDGSFQGLYFQNLTMSLPEGFKKFGSDDRINFSFNNLILGENTFYQGVTVDINKPNVLSFPSRSGGDEGDLGGWPFSINHLHISISDNEPGSDMSMSGKLKLPLSSQGIPYTCNMNTGDSGGIRYVFDVDQSDIQGRYPVNLWSNNSTAPTTLHLHENSTIEVNYGGEGTTIHADLNGNVTFALSSGHGGPSITLAQLPFSDMQLGNSAEAAGEGAPSFQFESGHWGLSGALSPGGDSGTSSGEQNTNSGDHNSGGGTDNPEGGDHNSGHGESEKVAGFGVNLSHFRFDFHNNSSTEYEAGVLFTVRVNIGFGDESLVSGSTDLGIYGKIDVPGTTAPTTSFDSIAVNKVTIKGDIGPVKVDGELLFRNNREYGHGIAGQLSAEFPFATLTAAAQFGTKEYKGSKMHYWGVGGSIYMEEGITMGPVIFNGFGGCLAHNMQFSPPSPDDINEEGNVSPVISMTPKHGATTFGATVYLSLVRPKILNASVTVSASIQNGAFVNTRMRGHGAILSDDPPDNEHPIGKVFLDITYNYPNSTFDFYVNTQINAAVATAQAQIWMHASPDSYYMYIGKPEEDQRVRMTFVNIDKPSVHVNLHADAYMDMGNTLPAFPQLPSIVRNYINQGVDADRANKSASDNSVHYLLQQLGAAGNPGFMFGAEVGGDIDVPIVPDIARVVSQATIGFDVALEQVKHVPRACLASLGRGKKFGMNNWYAMGQLYAYLHMDLTARTGSMAIFFGLPPLPVGNYIHVLTLTTGAVLQAGFPNPSWADGKVRIDCPQINLHGVYQFSFGNKCYVPYNPLDHIRMITKAGPKDSTNIFAIPYADFSLPMHGRKSITVPPDKHHDRPYTRTYRFRLTEFKLYKVNGNSVTPVPGDRHHTNDWEKFTLARENTLQPNTHYRIHIHCYAQELRNGSWGNPPGGPVVQDTTISFKTGPAPRKITSNNIVYTYPINGQRYLLKDEFRDKGRIQLGQWQGYILPVQPPGMREYNYLVKFIPEDGSADTVTTHFTPDKASKSLDFHIPSTLKNSTTYTMQVWVNPVRLNINPSEVRQQNNNPGLTSAQRQEVQNTLTERAQNTLHNNSNQGNSSQSTQTGNTIEVHGIVHPNVSYTPPRKPLFSLRFRTSKFNTFAEKMNALDPLQASAEDQYHHIKIYSDNENAEPFDEFEIKGYHSSNTTASQQQNHFPPMFSASIPYDAGNPTDKYYMDNLYIPAVTLRSYGFHIDLGAPEARSPNGFPSFALSTKDIAYSPPLGGTQIIHTGISASEVEQTAQIVNALDLNGGSGTYSFAGTQTLSGRSGWEAGSNVTVPGSYAGLQFHYSNINSGINAKMNSYASRSGHGYLNHQGSSGSGVPDNNTQSTVSSSGNDNVYHSFQLIWKRDEYFHADCQLLDQGYQTFEQGLTRLSQSVWEFFPSSSNSTLATGEYGSITFTGGEDSFFGLVHSQGRFIRQTQMQRLTPVLNTIKNLNFVSTQRLGTNRTIRFQYRYPCPDCGVAPVTVVKHLNEFHASKKIMQQVRNSQQSQQLPGGASSPPLILQFK